ncbi:hypothetical protein OQA88_5991 [Cercophora sp. LCS_1]
MAAETLDETVDAIDEDALVWVDHGLMLELAPFKLEGVAEYYSGGYHPVHLGDVLGDAYRIIHKLGHGGFATVWLARDLNIKDTTKYVALKIIMADSSGDDCPELLMDRIAGEMQVIKVSEHLGFPLSRFRFEGPNGSHLPHFRPHNILHPVTGLDGLSEEVLSILGEPRRNPFLDADGKENTMETVPRYLVYPVNWDDVDTKFLLKTPKVIDFGECFNPSDPPDDVGTPGYYRSPELLLEKKPGIPSDLWALACTLFEIRTGRKFFDSFDDDDDDYLGGIRCFKDDVDENGRVIPAHESQTAIHNNVHPSVPRGARSLVDKIEPGVYYMDTTDWTSRAIPDEEKPIFADLLGKLLQLSPGERMSAQEALEHEWFKI